MRLLKKAKNSVSVLIDGVQNWDTEDEDSDLKHGNILHDLV